MGPRMFVVSASDVVLIGQWIRNPGVFFAFPGKVSFCSKGACQADRLGIDQEDRPLPEFNMSRFKKWLTRLVF